MQLWAALTVIGIILIGVGGMYAVVFWQTSGPIGLVVMAIGFGFLLTGVIFVLAGWVEEFKKLRLALALKNK